MGLEGGSWARGIGEEGAGGEGGGQAFSSRGSWAAKVQIWGLGNGYIPSPSFILGLRAVYLTKRETEARQGASLSS